MSIRPIEIESLINFHQTVSDVAYDMALVRWLNAVAVALLFYDSLITLPDEVDLIWPKQWSVIKALTYLNRIITFCIIPLNGLHFMAIGIGTSDSFCRFLIITTGYAALVSFAMCNWILLARTKALLGEKRWINTILIIYYVLSYSATAALVTITEIKLYKKMFYSPNLQVCAVAIHPPTMGFIWIAPMIFETTIFLITSMKLYQKAKQTYSIGSELLSVLYRDGVVYYVVIILLRLYNLASWLILPPSFSFTGIFVLWSVLCIAVIRLQLNLIRAVDPRFQPTTVSASSFRGTRNFTNEIHTYNSRARSRDKRLTVGVYTSSSRPPSRRPSLARQEQMQPIQYAPPPLPQHVPYHPDDQTQESEPIQMYDLKNRPYASHTALLGSGADVSVIETQPYIPQERPSHPMTRDYGRESFPSNWYDTPRQSYVQP